MSKPLTTQDRRARLAVRRLLDAVDHVLAAAREAEAAREALDRESRQTSSLRIVPDESEDTNAT